MDYILILAVRYLRSPFLAFAKSQESLDGLLRDEPISSSNVFLKLEEIHHQVPIPHHNLA